MNRNNHPPANATRAHRVFAPAAPLDVARTLRPLQRGAGDPAFRSTDQGLWLALRRGGMPVSLHIHPRKRLDADVHLEAYSPDLATAQALLEDAERLLGVDPVALSDWAEFDERLGRDEQWRDLLPEWVPEARRRRPGLRFPATGALVSQLFAVVLEQKVTHDQARAGWRWLLRTAGEPAPGPVPEGLRVPPDPEQVRLIPSWSWHQGWVQPAMSRTMVQVAQRASALERLAGSVPVAELASTITAVPGIGPWTAAETLQRTHGSADLVSVGDYHLAHQVGEAMTGRRADDAGMLELLEPFRGHRHRVVRLLLSGGMRFSRFGPRLAPTDFRDR